MKGQGLRGILIVWAMMAVCNGMPKKHSWSKCVDITFAILVASMAFYKDVQKEKQNDGN
jgi:hypothetical protein